ncbi:MAG: [FeFe] hydrogenase H-cluster radical SAM maturase HydE [Clostridiales bacterium]|nr:[FeFe] hydrogenase H-cluster radical SAM maturase HydE [Clostridiales bacterium]
MTDQVRELIDKLEAHHSLTEEEYSLLVEGRDSDADSYAAAKADRARREIYGNEVFIRGLIEVSSYCKNDCLYCGLRRSNTHADRYRLTVGDILECADEGYKLGFRTFVLQGGEDPHFSHEVVCGIVSALKMVHPDCAVTLSLGEKPRHVYKLYREAGADRYLLRHETADADHYGKMHPSEMSFENRMRCLRDLRDLGFQVGCGFMVGSPYQTSQTLAKDLKFLEEFRPEMCGIGPFVPHRHTPFGQFEAGTVEQTLFLLSIIRLINPRVLLPATTALGTIDPKGRERGIQAGANVVMPNLSPVQVRKKYELYDGKICTGEEAAECIRCLDMRMQSIGYKIAVGRGDYPDNKTT